MDKFKFPFVLTPEEIQVKENDGLSKEIIALAKEEVCNAL